MNEKVKSIISTISLICFLLITPFGFKEDIDKGIARQVLVDTYNPVFELVTKGEYIGDKFVLEKEVSNDEFIDMMDCMQDHQAKSIYESLFNSSKDNKSIDPDIYIPTIHNQNSTITKAYIKRRKSLCDRFMNRDRIEEVMVISEQWKISGYHHTRTNYFERDSSGNWILDRGNGTSSYTFTKTNHNPWYTDRMVSSN